MKQIENALGIYKDKKATPARQAKGFVDFEEGLKRLEEDKNEMNELCLRLKLQLMCGDGVDEEYDNARSDLNEVNHKIGAVREAMNDLKKSMRHRVQIEVGDRCERLKTEIESIRDHRDRTMREFLVMLAAAVAYKEHIFGRPRAFLSDRSGTRETNPLPLPGIHTFYQRGVLKNANALDQDVALNDELEAFYRQEVKKARQNFGLGDRHTPLDSQYENLITELNETQEMARKAPEEVVKIYLDRERNSRTDSGCARDI